ncbi:hypothetical protein KCP71_02440 [Salmonella enterica subsp. enterica]|nr:hypothetical protein KCP71_02440 [Salmonella enterica subsp. enterica]
MTHLIDELEKRGICNAMAGGTRLLTLPPSRCMKVWGLTRRRFATSTIHSTRA